MALKSLFLVLLLPLCCVAVKPYTPVIADPVLEPWRWREMEELADLDILSMDEAADGSIWFGCIGGLARYDGRRIEFIPFDDGLLSGIAHDPNRAPWGKSVLCMRDGDLLAVVESGLVLRTGGAWKVIKRDVGHSTFESRLEQAEDGTVWLLMPNALWRFSADLAEQLVVLRATEKQRLTSFCRDPDGSAWVVRSVPSERSDLIQIPLQNGRVREEQDWRTYRVDIEKTAPQSSICAGPSGTIWYVDSRMSGALALDVGTGLWETFSQSDGVYSSLMRDRNGGIWAAGSGTLRALHRPDEDVYSSSQLNLPNIPLSLYETAEGGWWLVGRGGYVHTLDMRRDQWLTYEGLHFECETDDGRQWYLTEDYHVVSHDPAAGRWLEYGLKDGLISVPRSLHASSQGLVWAVGNHKQRAAFSVYNGSSWTRHELPDFAKLIWAGAAFEAKDGTVWLGAMGDEINTPDAGGALQYEVLEGGAVQLLERYAPPQFPYAIHRFAQTDDGLLWIGSPTIHAFDIANGKIQIVSELPGMFTHDLVVDGAHSLWAANGLSGVYRKEKDEWRHFSAKEGLAGRLVVDLLPMHDGTLLAASDGGISRFDGKSWAGAVFSADFGMSNRGGNVRESNDGAVWFNFNGKDIRSLRMNVNLAGKDPFRTVRYRPDQLAPDTSIVDHLDRVDSAGNIHISWSGKDVWLNTPSDQLQFSWRLNGGEWSPFSDKTDHSFVGLGRGRHTFEVRARDRDFNIDSTPALSRFTVVPAVWQRPWFIAMVLLIGGGTAAFIWMVVYYRNKRLRDRALHLEEIDQMKTGFFTNISHELNTPLGLIKEPLGRLLKNETDPRKQTWLDMALRNADRIENLVSQILDFRKLERGIIHIEVVEGDAAVSVRESIELLQPLANRNQISCRMVCENACLGWFDPDKLRKITSNLVGNALKYTPAGGNVVVELKTVEDADRGGTLSLVVEDTGPGVDPEHLPRIFDRFYRIPEKSIVDGSGIGLNLTKELVDLWGGEIHAESPIHSDPDSPGTRFTVLLPMELPHISNLGETHD
ncbi:ATP-binding protein [Pontiella sulfatireligans]|uniref:histidine kinase n=1 Tax=Pontiella sulfatireligans TaxID=2750658 RepID=A0A6C2UKU6_9BACT|nr:ATP-binding protein [Pontiella sulfatireligans]VGO20862.1 Alkaline phosphatase synthesis sensor protein PhoR [Pontiella sulfatireligans]